MFPQILNHSLSKSLKRVIKCYSAESAAALLLQGRGVWTGCNYWLQVFSVVRDLLTIINCWQQFRQLYKDRWAERTLQGPKGEGSLRAMDLPGPIAKIPQILPKMPPVVRAFSKGEVRGNCMFLVHWVLSLCVPQLAQTREALHWEVESLFSVTESHSNRTDSDNPWSKIVTKWTPGCWGQEHRHFQCLRSEGPFKALPCSVTRSLPHVVSIHCTPFTPLLSHCLHQPSPKHTGYSVLPFNCLKLTVSILNAELRLIVKLQVIHDTGI